MSSVLFPCCALLRVRVRMEPIHPWPMATGLGLPKATPGILLLPGLSKSPRAAVSKQYLGLSPWSKAERSTGESPGEGAVPTLKQWQGTKGRCIALGRATQPHKALPKPKFSVILVFSFFLLQYCGFMTHCFVFTEFQGGEMNNGHIIF